MTHYMSFWKSPQKIIFDLGNLISACLLCTIAISKQLTATSTDDKYTGIFNTTMTAIFYNSDVVTEQAPPSDLVIPISARQGANNSVSQFTLPAQNATNTISFPRNVRRAVFSVSANGQSIEEFWWSNVLQKDAWTFNDTAGEYPGYSPFREVQVLIDGQLAGVQWPFPVIFTGGVVPSLHRPIVGINAFDLREHEIDITPFLPLLCDGAQHTFTIRVAGINDSPSVVLTETVNESWYVTGKIFVWLDEDPSSITTGDPPTILAPQPIIAINSAITTTTNGTNETLSYTISVRRTLRISTPRLKTQHSTSPATWSQSLTYTNVGALTAFGFNQVNDLLISGEDTSSFLSSPRSKNRNKPFPYHSTYRYPLFANQSYTLTPPQNNLSISAHVTQSKHLFVSGPSVFPTGLEAFRALLPDRVRDGNGRDPLVAKLYTTKEGTGEFRQSGDGKESTGWGSARQELSFWVDAGEEGEMPVYVWRVGAVNGTVVGEERRRIGRDEDEEGAGAKGTGKGTGTGGQGGSGSGSDGVGGGGDGGAVVYAQVPVGVARERNVLRRGF